MALCVAIFDREDSLISLKLKENRFNSDVTATQIQHFLHNSYDIIIDKINNPSAKTNQDLFLGTLLLSTSFRSHGYLTNTGVKFVLVSDAENNAIKDQEIRIFFKKLHSIYCNALSNPFYKIGSQLNSRSVDKAMKDFFDSF